MYIILLIKTKIYTILYNKYSLRSGGIIMSHDYNSEQKKAYSTTGSLVGTNPIMRGMGAEYASQLDQAQISKVLRNTYALLALTLAFSAFTCFIGMSLQLAFFNPFVFLAGAYGLMFLTMKLKNSVWGLVSIFAFTGFLGLSLAPTINYFLYMPNGASIIISALGLTAFAFFGLSAFVLITRKDMSFLSNFLVVGFFILLGTMLVSLFTNIPGLYLAMSAGFILFSSAAILWQTSAIIHGGETNYISATISLFVQIYNIFVSLLNILGASRN